MKCPLILKGLLAAAGLAIGTLATAQTWPTKNVTMVVPWPPGGPTDYAARPLSKGLQEAFNKPVIVEYKPGASGNIGSDFVAKVAPDGYTILVTASSPIVINQFLYKKMPFDGQRDLAPVTNLLRVPQVLVVHPSVPAKNLQELRAFIKSKNGNFAWASAGNGTPQHMTGELFRTTAKLEMQHIPYKGSAPAITDLLGGHVLMMFDSTIAIMPHIKSGNVRPIAVSGAKRSPQLPDVPTFAEAGLPGVEAYGWYGMFVPAKTPVEIINKINEAALKFMKTPEYQKVLTDTGSDYVGDTPKNFAAFIKAEAIKWEKVAKLTGATLD